MVRPQCRLLELIHRSMVSTTFFKFALLTSVTVTSACLFLLNGGQTAVGAKSAAVHLPVALVEEETKGVNGPDPKPQAAGNIRKPSQPASVVSPVFVPTNEARGEVESYHPTFAEGEVETTTVIHESLAAEAIIPDEVNGAPGGWYRPIASSELGNSIVDGNARVRVEGQVLSKDSNDLDLAIEFAPPEQSAAVAQDPTSAVASPSTGMAGFSAEDALFRTKWGWAAYDLAKRAAREAGQNH